MGLVALVPLLVALPNQPPTITVSFPDRAYFGAWEEMRFEVTVADPDGDPVDLRVASSTRGLEFLPMVGAASPATREVRWMPSWTEAGTHELALEAFDAAHATARTRWSRRVLVLPPEIGYQDFTRGPATIAGRFDATDAWSIVCAASLADVGAAVDAGSIFVWDAVDPSLASVAPRATLRRAAPLSFERVGDSVETVALHALDVDADGFDDLVVVAPDATVAGKASAGAVLVWRGGAALAGSPAPWVEFVASTPTALDRLGKSDGVGLLFEDVTGDGLRDLVVASMLEKDGLKLQAGRLHVFKGGPSAALHPTPWATLDLPKKGAYDRLGAGGELTQGIQVADVTGDGVKDVVAVGAMTDDVYSDCGGVFVWRGGASLAGTVMPLASLRLPGTVSNDMLGLSPEGLQLADLDGDGVLDVVAASMIAEVGGVSDAGAVAFWSGGAGLVGAPAPTALLSHPNPPPRAYFSGSSMQGLSSISRLESWEIVDFNGDGIDDVVVLAPRDDNLSAAQGAIDVWFGRASWSAAPPPDATLLPLPPAGVGVPTPTLRRLASSRDRDVLRFADVTGDGFRDLIVPSAFSGLGDPAADAVIQVFAGGPALAGTQRPTAELMTPSGATTYGLGYHSIVVADVTGDGVDDVVSASPFSTLGWGSLGADLAGIGWVWAGGAGLVGRPAALAELRDAFPQIGDELGFMVHAVDVTGDGFRDVVLASSIDSAAGSGDSLGGAVVFAGGPTLAGRVAPRATLHPSAPYSAQDGVNMQFPDPEVAIGVIGDWDGDGVADLIGAASFADVGALENAGALFAWRGGSALVGTPAPDHVLEKGGRARKEEYLGGTLEFLLPTASSSRVLHVVSPNASFVGARHAGAIELFQVRGGTLFPGQFAVPGAKKDDALGAQ